MTFGIAWAQTSSTAPAAGAAPVAGASGGGSVALGFLVILGLLVIVGVAVKLYDRRRKRDAEAVHLQAQVSDALMRDARLAGMVLTPTAIAPTWGSVGFRTPQRAISFCASRGRRPLGSAPTSRSWIDSSCGISSQRNLSGRWGLSLAPHVLRNDPASARTSCQ
jgi:hypothetical protein